ncbi:unnamed protein product, partial [Rotaria socialis]
HSTNKTGKLTMRNVIRSASKTMLKRALRLALLRRRTRRTRRLARRTLLNINIFAINTMQNGIIKLKRKSIIGLTFL